MNRVKVEQKAIFLIKWLMKAREETIPVGHIVKDTAMNCAKELRNFAGEEKSRSTKTAAS